MIEFVENPNQKYLFHRGEGFAVDTLPSGTRLLYPRPPLPPIPNVEEATEQATEHPLDAPPLSSQLRPGMKVTIAFDDISLPLPPMQTPDIRERVIGVLLRKLGEAGVDDVHLICATSLHRRMTPSELRRVLGRKIYNAFAPDRLYNHDAEDKENVVFLGKTEKGEEVELNRRAVESDLLIYVNINLVTMDGGHKSVPVGLGTYRSVRHHHNVHAMMHSMSYMDPPNSELHHSCDRMGRIVNEHLNVFHIESTLNNDTFPRFLGFLQKRETRYSTWDWLNLWVNRKATDLLPMGLNRKIFANIFSPYGLTGIHAGRTDPVHERTLANIHRQQLLQVDGQADILIIGVPYICPYNVNSIMNPILIYCLVMGYFFNFYRGKPLVRRGGSIILLHPFEYKFHPVHHPSYIDFFEEVLTDTRDPAVIEKKHEERFATNPRYIDLYRHSYAYHGVHPFYMWYWGCYGMDWIRQVIAVKPRSEEAARRVGFLTASSLRAAVEMAREGAGPSPQITVYHCPPIFMCDVH
ncbi:MAG: DUF2088 domain-containing protein [Planctomycetes bacterium]|nr:DUF2088 domain-containing protein [Planctomycetota bacterium]